MMVIRLCNLLLFLVGVFVVGGVDVDGAESTVYDPMLLKRCAPQAPQGNQIREGTAYYYLVRLRSAAGLSLRHLIVDILLSKRKSNFQGWSTAALQLVCVMHAYHA